jgi:hypothetical protein
VRSATASSIDGIDDFRAAVADTNWDHEECETRVSSEPSREHTPPALDLAESVSIVDPGSMREFCRLTADRPSDSAAQAPKRAVALGRFGRRRRCPARRI